MFPCRALVAPCQRAAASIKGLPFRCQTRRSREASPPNGGRTWWAHFEFTRMNIEPIILYKKIEDLREARVDVDRQLNVPRSEFRDDGEEIDRRATLC